MPIMQKTGKQYWISNAIYFIRTLNVWLKALFYERTVCIYQWISEGAWNIEEKAAASLSLCCEKMGGRY